MKTWSHYFIILTMAVTLLFINFSIFKKEQFLKNGTLVYLKLAPVDPYSIMQGYYMVLNYKMPGNLKNLSQFGKQSGYLVLTLDPDHKGNILRVYYKDKPLAKGEKLIRYQRDGRNTFLGAGAYFFQEGHGKKYESAKYSKLILGDNGETILLGLLDKNLKKLGK